MNAFLTLSKEDGMAICKYSALEGDMPTFPMDEKYITFLALHIIYFFNCFRLYLSIQC